ncbi:MAG: PD-(D/E)XK nuclease family protein, partial [Candidatus Binataceae bacterium]
DSGDGAEVVEFKHFSLVMSRPDTAAVKAPVLSQNAGAKDCALFAASALARLEFIPPPAESLVLSPSELEVLARCPREYQLRYLAKLPEAHNRASSRWIAATPALADNGDDSAAINPLRMGLAAHAILERLDFGAGGAVAADELRRAAEAVANQADLNARERAALVRDLARYLAKAKAIEANGLIEREVPFMLKIGDQPMLYVRGRIDWLAVSPAHVTIRDYKYAHPKDAAMYQLQMEVYALAAAEAYPNCQVGAELIFLRDTPAVVPVALPPPFKVREHLVELTREYVIAHANNEWKKRPAAAMACRKLGCGYITSCWGIDLIGQAVERDY